MPGQLIIQDFDQLAGKGATLISKAGEEESNFQTIASISNPDEIWQGAAAAKYQDAFNRWRSAQTQMLSALRDMGTFLEQAANAYRAQDEAVMNSLGLL